MKNNQEKEKLFSVTDFEVSWFSGTGAGGQYRNKHQNCCRIKHKETGIIGTGQSNRNQEANRKEAFMSVVNNPRFQVWLKTKISDVLYNSSKEESIDDVVDREMKNIKIEAKDEKGNWVDYAE